jgi:hypothetical protein
MRVRRQRRRDCSAARAVVRELGEENPFEPKSSGGDDEEDEDEEEGDLHYSAPAKMTPNKDRAIV